MDRGIRQAWRQFVDRISYAATFAPLWLLDRIAGPEPPTDADMAREREKERLQQAFPGVDIDGMGAPTGKRRGAGGPDR